MPLGGFWVDPLSSSISPLLGSRSSGSSGLSVTIAGTMLVGFTFAYLSSPFLILYWESSYFCMIVPLILLEFDVVNIICFGDVWWLPNMGMMLLWRMTLKVMCSVPFCDVLVMYKSFTTCKSMSFRMSGVLVIPSPLSPPMVLMLFQIWTAGLHSHLWCLIQPCCLQTFVLVSGLTSIFILEAVENVCSLHVTF